MSQKWEYNGVTLEVDLQDADFAASYEKAFARLEESEKEMQKVGMNSEMIRGYCNLFYQLFDDIYGDGTGERLFSGKKNARMCDEAYRNFLTAAKKMQTMPVISGCPLCPVLHPIRTGSSAAIRGRAKENRPVGMGCYEPAV